MYIIPEELLREFRKVSSNNRSPQDGRHVETLAYLIGYQSDGNLIGTDLVFPKQSATSSHVDDKGKFLFNQILRSFVIIQINFGPSCSLQ